jgi:redox-sensing transcriptional repressor
MKLPAKTVERLSQYRRILQNYKHMEQSYIFSHDLAKLLKINPVQVRRDFMLIGFSGNYRNGYSVTDLLEYIDTTLTLPKGQKATIIGMGDIGKALLKHISSNPICPVMIPVTFDIDPNKTNQEYYGIKCYDLIKAPELLTRFDIRIAILAIVADDIQEIVDSLLISGIKSIVNFSAGPFRVPRDIYLKDFDIRTTLEEVSYFISQE